MDQYLFSCCRTVDEWSSEGLQALEMITMDMAKEAGQWRRPLWVFAKVIDFCPLVATAFYNVR